MNLQVSYIISSFKFSRMSYLKKFLAIALTMFSMTCFHAVAGIAVLDITESNLENESSGDWSRCLYSATYLCDIAGYDYTVTKSLDDAMEQNVILLSSCITTLSFSHDEWESIDSWVNEGGVLVSPAFRSVATASKDIVDNLFGIDVDNSGVKSSERTLIEWNPDFFDDPELEYIDDANERATSIGNAKSYALSATDAEVLACFNTGETAVVRNVHGNGKTYIIPVAWRDVVQRNQLNKDLNSSRVYNNGFEPSSDVWALFLRSIYAHNAGFSVWKFTVPSGYTQLLVPTHDCDSRTAYEEMHYMSDYEQSLGLSGHYFLTVHYFSDKLNFGHSYLSDFYNEETIPKAQALLDAGHTVGSHSICHFPDFNKTRNTDVVTRDEYAFRATCIDGVSTGASTWAEIVMSKQIIQEDLGNTVRSFRSGHLCVNPDFHAMMEEADYSFQSCYTGGDILSEFPFFGRFDNQWSGEPSNVLTMQLHISDVYNNKEGQMPLNDDTWNIHPAPEQWNDAMNKLRRNYASAILLIHPNREWKMTLQKRLIDQLDLNEVGLYNFEDYGDFWVSRLNTEYTYDFDKDSGKLAITTDTESLKVSHMTFAVDIFDGILDRAEIKSPDGCEILESDIRQISDHRYLVIPKIYNYGQDDVVDIIPDVGCISRGIYDLNGRLVYNGINIDEAVKSIPKGIYVVNENNSVKKLKI